MTEFWANKKFKQLQNEGQFEWWRRRCSMIGWRLFSCCCLDLQLTHTLSWQLAIVFVVLGMAGLNTTLLEHINFHAPPRFPSSKLFSLAHFQKIAKRHFARLQVKDTSDDSDSFSQMISSNWINIFHSSDWCVSVLPKTQTFKASLNFHKLARLRISQMSVKRLLMFFVLCSHF